uniref:Uncharacterized protein n=1 Tax=Monopterus albus TaxID=43700 RepID=A0A3Q3JPN9_MONAL
MSMADRLYQIHPFSIPLSPKRGHGAERLKLENIKLWKRYDDTENQMRKRKLIIFLYLLHFSTFVAPVTGFSLKACRMTSNTVICVKSHLGAVPRDIPSTVKVADLSENKISRIQVADFKNLPLLTQLELNRNHISQIDNGAFHLPHLRELYIKNNNINTFHSWELTNNIFPHLIWFNIGALINISCTIPTMSNLQLRYYKLRSVSSTMFTLCIYVTELDLTQNHIQIIHVNAFRSLPGLRILNLSQNKLSSVPVAIRNLPTLRELNLSANNISRLGCDDFANQTMLRQLSLYNNMISALNECCKYSAVSVQLCMCKMSM